MPAPPPPAPSGVPPMPSLAERTREIARCATGFAGFRYFLEKYARIEDQHKGVIPFEIWPCHIEALDALEHHQRLVVLKARQIGMSWLFGAAYPLWLANFHPGKLALLFSVRDDEAAELIRKIRMMWQQLPVWMRAELTKDNSQVLEFATGSRIVAMPSSPTAGSGYSASYVLSDEHAKQPYARQQFAAIRPTIDAGGKYVSISTANGPGTFHAQLWKNAARGRNGFKQLFFNYQAVPWRDAEWYESIKDTYEPWMLHQEYPREPEEAFAGSLRTRFKAEFLVPTVAARTPLTASEHPLLAPLLRLKADQRGLGFVLYQEPRPDGHYVIGADPSEGFADGDAQAALVLDRDSGEEVALLHGRWPLPHFTAYVHQLASAYRAQPLCVERNNHGYHVLYSLERLRLRQVHEAGDPLTYQLYYEKPLLGAQGQILRPGKAGWLTNAKSKDALFDALDEALMSGELRLATQEVCDELRTIEVDEDGRSQAAEGFHDDLVMALALAWMMVVATPRPRARPQVPYSIGHAGQTAQVAPPSRGRHKPFRGKRTRQTMSQLGRPAARPTLLQRLHAQPTLPK